LINIALLLFRQKGDDAMKIRSKKFIAIISVLVAVILIGISAGIVFAQDETNVKDNNPILTRVAEILNIDQQQLENAFRQAMEEQVQQRMDQHFQKLVEEGELTQEQADQYRDWLESKPDIPLPRQGKFMPRFGAEQRGFPGCFGGPIPEAD
jgi:Na+-transporting NADH:ubiquinone oxidoreductase subunit NqrC